MCYLGGDVRYQVLLVWVKYFNRLAGEFNLAQNCPLVGREVDIWECELLWSA